MTAHTAWVVDWFELGKFAGVLLGGGVLSEIIRSFTQRGQMDADTAKSLVESTTLILAPLNQRVQELTDETAKATADAATCRVQLQKATTDLAKALREVNDARREIEHLRLRIREYEMDLDGDPNAPFSDS